VSNLRLPRIWINEIKQKNYNEKCYDAFVTIELYPNIKLKISIKKLIQEPKKACCTGRLLGLNSSYIITLFSEGGPFASVYLFPPWYKYEHKLNYS
jgi:hypothetical protein